MYAKKKVEEAHKWVVCKNFVHVFCGEGESDDERFGNHFLANFAKRNQVKTFIKFMFILIYRLYYIIQLVHCIIILL